MYILLLFFLLNNLIYSQYRQDVLFESDTNAPILLAPDEQNNEIFDKVLDDKPNFTINSTISKKIIIESDDSLTSLIKKEVTKIKDKSPDELMETAIITPISPNSVGRRVNTIKFLNNNLNDNIITQPNLKEVRYFGSLEDLKIYNSNDNYNSISAGFFAMDKDLNFLPNYRIGGSLGIASLNYKDENHNKQDGHLYLGSLYGVYNKDNLTFLSSFNLGKDLVETKKLKQQTTGSVYGINNELRKKFFQGNYYIGPKFHLNMNFLKEDDYLNNTNSYNSIEGAVGFFAGQDSLPLFNGNLGWELGTNLYSEFGDSYINKNEQENYGDIGLKLFGNIKSVNIFGEYKQIITEKDTDWISSAGLKYSF
ncbi:hypothetical protein [Cetobacterium sp. SF1]|uniref:hypothetical protein n=1 Tax=Cetobacterium sp. SF1 TaxID=3417654 RepID=UPI003CF432C8